MRVEYTGKIGDDDIAFTRKTGEFGTSEFKADKGPTPKDAVPAEPSIPPGRAKMPNSDLTTSPPMMLRRSASMPSAMMSLTASSR